LFNEVDSTYGSQKSQEDLTKYSDSHLERAHEGVVHAHHCSSIVELPAVVRRREYCHQLPPGEKFVTIFYHLQCADRDVRGEGT
jgi:hypothetical protein